MSSKNPPYPNVNPHYRCNYHQSCMVVSTNEEYGDPCPDTNKYLQMQYTCVPEM